MAEQDLPRIDRFYTSEDERQLMELLYGPAGYYDQLSELFEQYGVTQGRCRIINRHTLSPTVAVRGEKVDGGTISITSAEVPAALRDGRWKYRILLPSESAFLRETHRSEHYGGRIINSSPVVLWHAMGQAIYLREPEESFLRFSSTYTQAVDDALRDIVTVTLRGEVTE